MVRILNETLSDDIVKEIGKFTIIWCHFEKEFCSNKCNSNKIRDIAHTHIVNKKILKELSIAINNRAKMFNIDSHNYIQYNLIPNGAISPAEKDKMEIQNFINFTDGDLLCGALLTIYRIRNNLLHGLKTINELDGQIELFKAMNMVLESIKVK